MLLALLASPAFALPWWVDDAGTAAALEEELDTLWSGHPIEVVVGPAPPDTSGLHYDGAALELVTPDRTWRQEAPDDLATLVLLARSWSTAVAAADTGWVPPAPPVPEPLPEPVPPPVPDSPAPTSHDRRPTRFDLGIGLRDSYRESGWFEGPRVVARSSWDRFELEAVAFFASGTWTKVGALDRTLLKLNTSSDRIEMPLDTATVAVLAGCGLPDRIRVDHRPSFAPFAAAGVELHRWTVRTLVLPPDGDVAKVTVELDPASASWRPVGIVEGGVELGWGHAAGLRLGVSESAGGALFADVLIGL